MPIIAHSPHVVELDGGTVWILARSLAPGLPDDAYAGFTITRGTLTFPQPLTVSGDRLTYTEPLSAVLDANPAPAALSGHLCPAEVTVTGPEHVRITWKSGKITISPGPGSATFGGNIFNLAAYTGPPRLDADLGIVFFPYKISPAEFDAATLTSEAATFSGTTAVDGGWALSLTRPDTSGHLGEALGPGLYVFYSHDVLHVRWRGAPGTVDLADARLVVRQGQLLLTARHGSAPEPFTQTIRLWAVRAEADAPRLPLRLHVGSAIVFTYFCDAAAGYGFYTTCGAEVALDRPVTVAGAPLVFPDASQAWFGVQHSSTGTIVRVAALAKSFRDKRELIALRNALVSVTQPAFVVLEGALTGDNAIDSGTLTLALRLGCPDCPIHM